MSDPLREAATRLADEWQHGTADDEYCERLDVACAALREALAIEPEYEWSIGFDNEAHRTHRATCESEEVARRWRSRYSGAYIERRIKAGEWERLP